MPYMDETDLAYYSGKLKQWIASQPVKTLPSSLYPWTLTAKAGAVTCWPVGGTELLPTVDFMFAETGPASGDKGPENPSAIAGVSSINVTRTNTNLLLRKPAASGSFAGIAFTCDGNGSYTANGTATGGFSTRDIPGSFNWNLRLLPNGRYTLRFKEGVANIRCGSTIEYRDGTISYPGQNEGAPIVLTDDIVRYVYYFYGSQGTSYSNAVSSPYLVMEGSDAVFEMPQDNTYTRPLGSTYYGGTVDLATGVMTVTWEGDVLSASNFSTVGFSQNVVTTMVFNTSRSHGGGSITSSSVLTCNRFPTVSGSGDTEHCRFSGAGSGSALNVYIDKSRLDLSGAVDPSNPTSAELKAAMIAWLEANPTLVAYQLSEPFTVTLTPTQILSLAQPDKYMPRLNTVYTDASAVQVGYVKSPIREEFELQQAIVAQGGSI